MGVLRLRVGRWLRSRARASLLVALTIVVVATAILALAAGARRTSTAPDRYAASRADLLEVVGSQDEGDPVTAETIRTLPAVDAAESMTFMFAAMLLRDERPLDNLVFSGTIPASGDRLVEGRAADPDVASEFVLSRAIADERELSPGDRVRVVTLTDEGAAQFGFDLAAADGPTFEATLVGLIDGQASLSSGVDSVAIFSPALLDDERIGRSGTVSAIGLANGSSVTELRRQLDTLPNGELVNLERDPGVGRDVRTAVRGQALGLWALVLVGGLAAIVALGQMLTRLTRLDDAETDALVALGYARHQLAAEAAARAALIAIVAVVVAAATAVVASGIFPTGFVRLLEPDPGVRLDAVVLGVGAAVLAVALVGWVALATRLGTRAHQSASSTAIDRAVARCPSAAVATGVRFAFSPAPAHSSAARLGSLAGLALIVVAIVGTIVFGTSTSSMVDEPFRYGVNYDFAFDNGADVVPDELSESLLDDADVEAVTLYTARTARIGSVNVPIAGVQPVRGSLEPVIVEGRSPVGVDEIAIGRRTARQLDIGLGDDVTVTSDVGPVDFVVTAIIVPPGLRGNDAVGAGAIVTGEGFTRLDPEAAPNVAVVAFRDGVPPAAAVQRIAEPIGFEVEGGGPLISKPPAILNIGRITFVPFVLGGLLVMLAMLMIANTVHTGVRRREHDVGVLRTLGAGRRWLATVVRWQAAAWILLALAIGIPLGLAVGQVAFRSFATRIGAVDDPTISVLPIGGVMVGLLLLGLIVAVAAGRRARRGSPAALLRTAE